MTRILSRTKSVGSLSTRPYYLFIWSLDIRKVNRVWTIKDRDENVEDKNVKKTGMYSYLSQTTLNFTVQ